VVPFKSFELKGEEWGLAEAMSAKRSSRNHPSLFGVVLNELPQTENGERPSSRARARARCGCAHGPPVSELRARARSLSLAITLAAICQCAFRHAFVYSGACSGALSRRSIPASSGACYPVSMPARVHTRLWA
jgi:hypothetical protein